jgi:hypothetical protein
MFVMSAFLDLRQKKRGGIRSRRAGGRPMRLMSLVAHLRYCATSELCLEPRLERFRYRCGPKGSETWRA